GTIHADIYHPSGGGGRHGAIIFLLGAGELPLSDLAVRFAEAMARLGVVVMLPNSSGLLAERLTFDEVDGLRAELNVLDNQADVDPERVGFVGLSAAGGLSIVAAGQADLRDRVRFVNSFGSYYDATQLLLDVSSRSIDVNGKLLDWQPQQRTQEVVSTSLSDVQDDAVRELLAGADRHRSGAAPPPAPPPHPHPPAPPSPPPSPLPPPPPPLLFH